MSPNFSFRRLGGIIDEDEDEEDECDIVRLQSPSAVVSIWRLLQGLRRQLEGTDCEPEWEDR